MKPKIKQLLTKTECTGLNEISLKEFLNKCPYSESELKEDNRIMNLSAWRCVYSFLNYITIQDQVKTSKVINRNRSSITYNCHRIINFKTDFVLKEVINELVK